MYLPDVELHECATLTDASAFLARYAPNARILAGGTDLLVDLKTGRAAIKHLVGISRVASLRGVCVTPEGLQVGALTTITQLHRAAIVREKFAPIRDATGQMAAPQVRNSATVGGNIASAVPCADLPPILTVMSARVRLWSPRGTREVALDAFFRGPRQTCLEPGEILSAVIVPTMPIGFGAAFARFALREGNAIAVASVATGLRLDGSGVIREARIALGAVAPIPQLVGLAAELLVGARPSLDAFEAAASAAMQAARPISDVRGSAEFRRELVEVLTRRALSTALLRARENTA